MKTATAVTAAVLVGSLTAQLGLSYAPALFTTYFGTGIVTSVMLASGLIAAKVSG